MTSITLKGRRAENDDPILPLHFISRYLRVGDGLATTATPHGSEGEVVTEAEAAGHEHCHAH